jgi:type II secretory pathway predicted ATPase ExeA
LESIIMRNDEHDARHEPVLTPAIRDTIEGCMHARLNPGLQVILGGVGVGKTTLARYMVDQLKRGEMPKVPTDYRGLYFAAAGDTGARGMKHGIYRLHAQVIGELTQHQMRTLTSERLASDVVNALRKKSIQMVFVDEAGTLSAEEIRGFVTVFDLALHEGFVLTFVLVGTEPLRIKIKSQEQVNSRVMHWVRIEPWDLDDMWTLLRRLSPRFQPPEAADDQHRELVAFVHDTYGGVPRDVLPFLNELELKLAQKPETPFDLTLFKFVAAAIRRGRDNGDEDA